MILYEFEGKELLSSYGINTPKGEVLRKAQTPRLKTPLILKAQTLSGKRAEAGSIKKVEKEEDFKTSLKTLLGKKINKEEVTTVLAEEIVDHDEEYYVSLSYDTASRGPVLTLAARGGTDVEKRESLSFPVSPLADTPPKIKAPAGFEKEDFETFTSEVFPKLLKLFFDEDLTLLEINPLVFDKDGKHFALDAKVKIDDSALARHPAWDFPPRSVAGHTPTKREVAAKKIDEGDHRGTAGSAYFDLEGDIAVLASGGGASLTAMDALIAAGGKPANYTEYSGNPPKEKVEKLTKIVLSKEGINGLWVVGAVDNFTDIYETLLGFIEALRKVEPKPKLPIVIRRGGPRDKEAFEMLRKVKDFDLHLYGEEISIAKSAEIMTKLAKKYATST